MYHKGKVVPMAEVTRGVMCSIYTLTRWDQDPDVDFPDAVKRTRQDIPLAIGKLLRFKPSIMTKLREQRFGHGGLLCRRPSEISSD